MTTSVHFPSSASSTGVISSIHGTGAQNLCKKSCQVFGFSSTAAFGLFGPYQTDRRCVSALLSPLQDSMGTFPRNHQGEPYSSVWMSG